MAGKAPAIALDGQSNAAAMQRVAEYIREQENQPLNAHHILEVTVPASSFTTGHKLGRTPQGVFLVKNFAGAGITISSWNASTITGTSDTATTVTFLVF